MSNTAPSAQHHTQAFEKSSGGRVGAIVPVGLELIGLGLAGLSVLTALSSAPTLVNVGKALDRAGLDKGPLLLFGLALGATGLVLGRIERVRRSMGASSAAASTAEAVMGELEDVSAILGSVQGELSAVRAEVHEARVEAHEAERSRTSTSDVNDPMFRLAASLDQLGARIDKRMDSARKEMLGAVQDVAARVDAAQPSEDARRAELQEAKEFEALRMDIADLGAQLKILAEDVARMVQAAAEAEAQPAELPRELYEDPEGSFEETEPETLEFMPEASDDWQDGSGAEETEMPAPFAITCLTHVAAIGDAADEFPEPPAPMPKPSEGLRLIDDMDEDTARTADLTPPLFPELDHPHDAGH